jgi:hypothetical protein
MSAVWDFAFNALNAAITGIISIVAFVVVLGLPVWLLTHFALSGARKTLAREESDER